VGRRLVPIVALVALTACQGAPAPAPRTETPTSAPSTPSLAAEAQALAAKGDFQGAAERYRQAAALDPRDPAIRFGLGVVYSHLDRRTDAIEQLRFVVQHADRDGAEYREARRWLTQVGVTVAEPAPAVARATASTPEEMPVMKGTAWLTGHSVWPRVNPKTRIWRGEITLAGDDDATRSVTRSRPFRLGLQYDFPELVPGRYRLTASVVTGAKHTTLWDQKIVVPADQRTELVLTPASARVSPEEFPPPESPQ
jgi:tetratricopeptide (TPR) repeat protein